MVGIIAYAARPSDGGSPVIGCLPEQG